MNANRNDHELFPALKAACEAARSVSPRSERDDDDKPPVQQPRKVHGTD